MALRRSHNGAALAGETISNRMLLQIRRRVEPGWIHPLTTSDIGLPGRAKALRSSNHEGSAFKLKQWRPIHEVKRSQSESLSRGDVRGKNEFRHKRDAS